MSGYEPAFLGFLVILMRTGTAMMVLPGFSAMQVPSRVRLFIALAVSISVFALIDAQEGFAAYRGEVTPALLLQLVATEAFIGLALALPVRLLFLALAFAGETIMQFIGLNAIPGTPVGDDQPSTTLSGIFNITALVLFFASGAHLSFIFGLAMSFSALPPGEILSVSALTQSLAEDMSTFFNIVIRLSAPIIIYSVIMNLVAGLVNKLTPQIPIYFVSTPFLIFGGAFILVWVGDDMLFLFNVEVNRLIDAML